MATNQKSTLCLSLGENVGIKDDYDDDNFFYDVQQYVSNDQAYGKQRSNKG
jgi:hypothetical protein